MTSTTSPRGGRIPDIEYSAKVNINSATAAVAVFRSAGDGHGGEVANRGDGAQRALGASQ
jgi:hypothetical protein